MKIITSGFDEETKRHAMHVCYDIMRLIDKYGTEVHSPIDMVIQDCRAAIIDDFQMMIFQFRDSDEISVSTQYLNDDVFTIILNLKSETADLKIFKDFDTWIEPFAYMSLKLLGS